MSGQVKQRLFGRGFSRMNADNVMNELKHGNITEKILAAFFRVYNVLGYGFLEKVYENALLIELKKLGLLAVAQHPIRVNPRASASNRFWSVP